MPGKARGTAAVCVAAVTGLAVAISGAGVPAQAAQSNDYCGGYCADILPPGENGNATLADILASRALGTRPAHADDQLSSYGTLANKYGSVTNATIKSVTRCGARSVKRTTPKRT